MREFGQRRRLRARRSDRSFKQGAHAIAAAAIVFDVPKTFVPRVEERTGEQRRESRRIWRGGRTQMVGQE